MELKTIQTALSQMLGMDFHLGFSDTPCLPSELTPQEQVLYKTLRHSRRQVSWLTGRKALKDLLSQLNEPTDTSILTFPHPRISLTHSETIAFAIGFNQALQVEGIGDHERFRAVRERSLRLFLTASEIEAVAHQPDKTVDIIRLWTVKEALLKADPDNSARQYRHYVVQETQAHTGDAVCLLNPQQSFKYASYRLAGGFLSIAVGL